MPKAKTNQAFFQSPENARSRALLKGMGYSTRDLKQPRIGVANSWGETSPGHFHLRALGDAVKAGIWQAGGTPFEFNSFGQCPMDIGGHGIRYDTATRDIVAAEIEAAAYLHMFDGMVMISSCDKNVPANQVIPPDRTPNIITGTAKRISFLTPESEVNVLHPVKFIAKYAVTAGAIRKRATRLVPLQFEPRVRLINTAHSSPICAPFKEKALPGIQRRSSGVTKDPISSAPR